MLVTHRDEKNVAAIEKLIGQPIERRVMEGIPEETPRRDHGKPAHGRERNHRRDRHSRREGQVSQRQEHREPVVEPTEMPRRAEKSSERQQPRDKAPVKAPIESQAPAANHHHQLPAFLLRPVVLPKPTKKAASGSARLSDTEAS